MNTTTNTLGQTIGIVKKTLKVSQYKGGPSAQITIKIDFTHATDDEIRNWLASDRCIAGQRPWRSLSPDEVKALDGQTFQASSIGTKVKSREEKIRDLMGAGLPEALAIFSVDNPEAFAQVMNSAIKPATVTETAEPEELSQDEIEDDELEDDQDDQDN